MKVISAEQPFLENILNIIDNLRGVVSFRYIISIEYLHKIYMHTIFIIKHKRGTVTKHQGVQNNWRQ